jgi:membrane fusion protein (multidrug efflux system)
VQATLNLAQRQLRGTKGTTQERCCEPRASPGSARPGELDLSYTTVTAAQLGRVVNLGAAGGQFAQPGTNLTMFVPDQIWVTANFKEIQLDA